MSDENLELRAKVKTLEEGISQAVAHVECLHDADPQPDTAQWLDEWRAKG